MSKMPLGTIRKTGQKCPESGVWEAQANPSGTIPLSYGETFPPHNDKAVNWRLISYA